MMNSDKKRKTEKAQEETNESQVTVVLGEAWGDEGKGKLIDELAKRFHIVCRFAGGTNAGHTVNVNGVEHKFHLLPSGALEEHVICILGNGVAVNLSSLSNEIGNIEAHTKLADLRKRIFISDRAHLVFEFHKEADAIIEDIRKRNGDTVIGTTKQGIGNCYKAKASRRGVRACQYAGDWNKFVAAYENAYKEEANYIAAIGNEEDIARLYKAKEAELPVLQNLADGFRPCIVDTILYLNEQLQDPSKRILIEGANAALLDLDFGTYPYVTSSSCTVGGACTGLGIPASAVGTGTIIGVIKAYTTRVGEGAFPTELTDETGKHLQEIGKEFGTTTGRKRRCGWMDAVVAKYSNMLNGYTCFNLTKLDVMTGLKEIKIGVSYKHKGKEIKSMPADLDVLKEIEVEYETLPGWTEDISDVRKYEDLPENARRYIERIEELVGVPIKYIGVGSSRDATIVRN